MALFVLLSLFAALLTMATALSVSDFLQLIFPSSGEGTMASVQVQSPVEQLLGVVYDWLVQQGPQRALLLYALLLLLLYGLKNLCSYLSAVTFAQVKTRILCALRNGIHRGALEQNFRGWSSQAQGQWLSRMSNDMAEYEANVLDSIQLIVQSVVTLVIYVLMLLYLDWRMTLMVVAVMAVGTAMLSLSRRLKRQSRHLQELNGALMTTTQETLESLKEIKAATAIDYVNARQQEQNQIFTRRRISLYRRIYAASPISDFVGNAIVVAILLLGAQRVLGVGASLSPALFVSYIMIYVLLLTPIKEFSNAIAQLKKGHGIESRIEEAAVEPSTDFAERHAADTIDRLELENICFSYGSTPVLDHLNFSLPMMRHTALVGGSGSGKTTLGRIIVGLLEPDGGRLLLNGVASSASFLRGRVGYVPQEPMLFNSSIEENIRFGRPEITHEQVLRAARQAQLEPLIHQLPEGLDTVIGDGGGRLSGGERQRVSIARALAASPSVLVMDEATAALDAATESLLDNTLRQELTDTTLVLIAHRASTIAHCDGAFDVEQGCWLRGETKEDCQ